MNNTIRLFLIFLSALTLIPPLLLYKRYYPDVAHTADCRDK